MTQSVEPGSTAPELAAAIKSIPCDPDLLAPIGLVVWATTRLQHSIRDVYDSIRGYPSNDLFKETPLGSAVDKLQKMTSQVPEPLKSRIRHWCKETAFPSVHERNGVAHAIAYTAEHGRQGLGDMRSGRLEEYTVEKIARVAMALEDAAKKLYPLRIEVEEYRRMNPVKRTQSRVA